MGCGLVLTYLFAALQGAHRLTKAPLPRCVFLDLGPSGHCSTGWLPDTGDLRVGVCSTWICNCYSLNASHWWWLPLISGLFITGWLLRLRFRLLCDHSFYIYNWAQQFHFWLHLWQLIATGLFTAGWLPELRGLTETTLAILCTWLQTILSRWWHNLRTGLYTAGWLPITTGVCPWFLGISGLFTAGWLLRLQAYTWDHNIFSHNWIWTNFTRSWHNLLTGPFTAGWLPIYGGLCQPFLELTGLFTAGWLPRFPGYNRDSNSILYNWTSTSFIQQWHNLITGLFTAGWLPSNRGLCLIILFLGISGLFTVGWLPLLVPGLYDIYQHCAHFLILAASFISSLISFSFHNLCGRTHLQLSTWLVATGHQLHLLANLALVFLGGLVLRMAAS